MNVFIRGLFIDLHNKLEKMITHLDNLSMESPIASDFKAKTVASLFSLKDKVDKVIESGILDIDTFISNSVIKYNSLNNEFIEIELFRYLAISKYDNKADGHFEKIIHKIYDEIQCLQSVPFISTISNSDSYYWAYPKYNMIALPQGEEKNILNLSDLYHEIGHLIFQQSEDFLVGEHIPRMKAYYSKEKVTLKEDGHPDDFINELDEAMGYWNSSWSEEFTCDLIGTFLVGPAYAWTNMKISTVSSSYNAVYSHGIMFREHPPDEARMRAIFRMLELTGFGTEVMVVRAAWDKFLAETQNSKPGSYDFIFPDEMIESITMNVLEGCQNIGLRSYSQQLQDFVKPVSLVLNDAWDYIRKDPNTFNTWEAKELGNLI
jgi:hypothetical protein